MGAFIYQPALKEVQEDLHTTTNDIALSLSLFILFQGTAPLAWASVSEIRGRKFVYIIATTVCNYQNETQILITTRFS